MTEEKLIVEELHVPTSEVNNTIPQVHDDADDARSISVLSHESYDFPEGGLKGWFCVAGSFLGVMGSLGWLTSLGTLQAHLQNHQLQQFTAGQIGWIFSVFAFTTFLCGIQIGPIFDARGPHELLVLGTILVTTMNVTIGFCTQYWHFMLTIGVVGGMGLSLFFTTAFAAIGHFFLRKRAFATGIAVSGCSIGGIVLPLTFESLIGKVGFAWATRVTALICFVCMAAACILVSSRLPKKSFSRANVLPDFHIFSDSRFLLTTLAIFFTEWGLFIPVTYVPSYAIAHGMGTQWPNQLLAILNAASVLGRWMPGYLADRVGRFNILIATVSLCVICNGCLWLLAGDSLTMMVLFCVCFGFASGSNVSLGPVCIGQLCITEDYGRYYGAAYTMVSISTLTGIPIAGEILSRCDGQYWGLITFTILCYAASLICACVVKVVHCGWRQPWAVW